MQRDFARIVSKHSIQSVASSCRHMTMGGLSRAAMLIAVGVALSACGSTGGGTGGADINNKTKFSKKTYGVSASKRVTTSKNVKKGGGSYKIGKPYKVRGNWYHPKEDKNYDKKGLASWYGPNFHGRRTANGEIYDQYHLSAAHPTFPLPSYARVTNLTNGHSVVVRVNDRGPFAKGRIIDLSSQAADLLEMKHHGLAKVRVQYVGKARMDGRDMPFLMASYEKNGRKNPLKPENKGFASGVMLALKAPQRAVTSVIGKSEPVVAAPVAVSKGSRIALAPSTNDLPIVKTSAPAGTEGVLLPEIGPVPTERPSIVLALTGDNQSAALSAYAQSRIERQAINPFTHILSGGLQLAKR